MCSRLQALVYDILIPAGYVIGSLQPTAQITSGVSFSITAHTAYASTNKTQIV